MSGPSRRVSKRRVVSDDEDRVEESPAKRGRVASSSTDSDDEANGSAKPRIDKGKGRAIDVEEDDSDKDTHGSGSRSRTVEDEGEEEGNGMEEDQEEDRDGEGSQIDEEEGVPRTFHRELERGDDGYVVGSVTRIKLRNFMTYDFVQFRPGPRLNMILGPNGTGKSSIAAAIAIGLGFSPGVMGRAPNLQAYVKQGTEQGETEIELKAPRGKRNYIITRRFQKGNEKSVWQLNGKNTTKKEVDALVANLGVQANNLCSFLPQDKVAEFAKMNPVDVLRETMRSAGDSRLTKWHGQLSEYGKQVKEFDNTLTSAVHQRDNLQVQVDELEPDIRNYDRRRDLQQELKLLKILLIASKNHAAKQQADKFKAELVNRKEQHRALQARFKPLADLKADQEYQYDKCNHATEKAVTKIRGNETAMAEAKTAADKMARDGNAHQRELDKIHDKKKRRLANIRQQEDRIQELQRRVDEPQADVQDEVKAKKAELIEKTTEFRQLQRERDALSTRVEATADEAQTYRRDIDNRNARMVQLSDTDRQRREQTFQFEPSIQYAVEYIENNEMLFEAKVLYPPMISVHVSDTRYAWQVEACTSVTQRKTFICQNQNDYRKLMALNKKRVTVNGRPITVALHIATVDITEESANPARPCSPEKLQELGLDGFAIDYVEADAGIVAFLCQAANLHRAAVTLRPSTAVNQDDVMAAGITQWHTATDSNRGTRSAYGRRESVVSVTAPVPARAFNLSVDKDAVKKLEVEVANYKRNLKDLEQPLGKMKAEFAKVNTACGETEREYKKLNAELKKLQETASRQQRAHVDLELAKGTLRRLKSEADPEASRGDLTDKVLEKVEGRLTALKKLTVSIQESVTGVSTFTTEGLKKAQFAANIAEISDAKRASTSISDKVADDLGALAENYGKWRKMHDQAMRILQDVMPKLSGPLKKSYFERVRPNPPPSEDVQNDIANVQAQLEASVGVSPEAVERYKRLSEQLSEKKKQVSTLQKDHSQLRKQVEKILGVFNPALDALVEEASVKFAAAFARVKCSGQLEVDREADYSDWGIKILVAFRDGESLETLKMHRHSGGERSLATVTYLMSLSSMSRTPFSLVDEINQGMDARAERNVHDSMVGVTCSHNVGQYFLITPKLLTGLDYHRDMKILIVNNGPWIPEGAPDALSYGSLGACLSRYKRHHAITA